MAEEASSVTTVAPAANVREFFRELIGSARTRHKLAVQDETEAYLVNLLVEFLDARQLYEPDSDGRVSQAPLAFMLQRAIEAPREERARQLRRMGDTALYVSGFFSDSLQRQLVDVDYYASMGGRAYGALRDMSPGARAGVFGELASKFLHIVDLFSDISERSAVTSNAGILRVYERYVRTGSSRLRQMLEERGVVPLRASLVEQ